MDVPLALKNIRIRSGVKGYRRKSSTSSLLTGVVGLSAYFPDICSVRHWSNMSFRYVLCLLMLVSLGSQAQLSKTPNKHFIIALDYALPKPYSDFMESPRMLDSINKVLVENGYNGETDYVSFLKYSFNSSSFASFIRPVYDLSGSELLWHRFQSNSSMFENLKLQRADCNYSFQSGAKQYLMSALQRKDESLSANETILLMITDEKCNGTDDSYTNEWKNITSTAYNGENRFNKPQDSLVYKQIELVNGYFNFRRYEKQKVLTSSKGGNPYEVVFYSVEPRIRPSLFNTLDLPAQLPLRRVRGGYRLELDVHETTSDYKLVKLEVYANNYEAQTAYSSSVGRIDTKILSKYLSNGDSITLKAWIRYNDGIYNAAVLNPYSVDFGRGLTLKQQVRLNDDASILGLIPLYDFMWWWFPNDIQRAIEIWDVLLILIAIALLVYVQRTLSKKIGLYIPSNSDISMNIKSSRNSESESKCSKTIVKNKYGSKRKLRSANRK